MSDKLFITKILIYAKKYRAIQILGGECENCKENRFFRLSFHHPNDNKEKTISYLYHRGNSWKIIENEIKKCNLLCHNCHQEFHFNSLTTSITKESKKLYLEFKNVNGCKECGYNKCNESLTFHHFDKKKLKLSDCRCSNINKIKDSIIEELDKCDVLCCNCHTENHSDLKFFNENIELIIEKSKNLRNYSKLNKEKIKKMYFDDKIKQIDIAKYFNCSKGSISNIIKNLKS